jgi:hypothetical protein
LLSQVVAVVVVTLLLAVAVLAVFVAQKTQQVVAVV